MEMAHHRYMMEVDRIRGEIDAEIKAHMAEEKRAVKDYNLDMVEQKRDRLRQWREREEELNKLQAEHTAQDLARRQIKGLTPDKGMREEQVREMLRSNEQLLAMKEEQQRAERLQELAWAVEQDRVLRMVNEGHAYEQQRKKEYEAELADELRRQQKQNQLEKLMSRQERFGDIAFDKGTVYGGFGTSIR